MRRFDTRGNGLYRSRNGVVLGVCRGLAEYFDLSVFWVRFAVLICLLLSGIWPIAGIYAIAALMMKPEPVLTIDTYHEQELYDSYVCSRKGAAHRLKRRYEGLERRIRRMEDVVTSTEFDWENRMDS